MLKQKSRLRNRWALIKGDKKWRHVLIGIRVEQTNSNREWKSKILLKNFARFLQAMFFFSIFVSVFFLSISHLIFWQKTRTKAKTSSTLRKLQTGWIHPPCPKKSISLHLLTIHAFSLSLSLTLSFSFSLSHTHTQIVTLSLSLCLSIFLSLLHYLSHFLVCFETCVLLSPFFL